MVVSGAKSERRMKGRSPYYSGPRDNELKVVQIWLIISILKINCGLFS